MGGGGATLDKKRRRMDDEKNTSRGSLTSVSVERIATAMLFIIVF